MQRVNRLPGAIIIGAQRSGTSRLYVLLIQHPEIAPAAQKEIHFYDRMYENGLEWYGDMFPDTQGRIGLEGTPYYIYHPLSAKRIWESQPEVKIIVILRNPVDRAYSNYYHELRMGKERLVFEAAIIAEDGRIRGEEQKIIDKEVFSAPHNKYSYKHRGYYARQLERYYALFPRENIFVIESGEFYRGEAKMVSQVFEFLGVEPLNLKVEEFTGQERYSKMKPSTREMLLEHFAPHNEKLETLVERDFNWKR